MNKVKQAYFFLLTFIILFHFFQTISLQGPNYSYQKQGSEFQVNTYTDNSQYAPAISSIGKNGKKFVVTWNSDEPDESRNDIFAQVYWSSNGSKAGSEFQVNDYSFLNQAYPTVTSIEIEDERFVIAWDSFRDDTTRYGIFAQIYDSHHGTRIGEEFQVNTNNNSLHRYPAASSIGQNGESFVITWWSCDQEFSYATKCGIFFQRYNSTNLFVIGEEMQAHTYGEEDTAKHPAISSLGQKGERFVIAWETEAIPDGSKYEISAQLFDSYHGSKIGQEFLINSFIPGEQSYPAILSIGINNEKFIVAWQSYGQDSSYYGIFAHFFDSSNGLKIDKVFQVNTNFYYSQKRPSIASLGQNKDRFVITWDSIAQDGSSTGVYAQVYYSSNGSTIGKEFQVNTHTESSQRCSAVSSFGKNKDKFVVTWQSLNQDGSVWGVFGQIFENTTTSESDDDNDEEDFEIYHINSSYTLFSLKQALISLIFLFRVLYFGYF
ncbi:hypothetical protein M0812_24597 [Anaeramoeba flamelloides]|uniref:Uncharacterized protein n=1 Tax=Anaeramoeba flamelloides TaxID=1746091 RepID=A0AAV7YHK2_9EUKA|nr:hypothetical protein M0812_24597 [Anaeramoeba flamelloides]